MLSDSAKKAKYDKWLLEIIKKDTDFEPKKSKSYSQPHQQEQQTKLIMHLLTIEGYIREKYIDVRNLKILTIRNMRTNIINYIFMKHVKVI